MQPGNWGSRRILIWQRRTLNRSRNPSANKFRGATRCKRPDVQAFVRRNPARHVAARISITQIDFHDSRRAKTKEITVALRKMDSRLLVERQRLFEARTGEPETNSCGNVAQIQTLGESFGRMQKTLGRTAEIDRTRKIRLCAGCMHFDEVDGRAGGQRREKIFIAGGVEL